MLQIQWRDEIAVIEAFEVLQHPVEEFQVRAVGARWPMEVDQLTTYA